MSEDGADGDGARDHGYDDREPGAQQAVEERPAMHAAPCPVPGQQRARAEVEERADDPGGGERGRQQGELVEREETRCDDDDDECPCLRGGVACERERRVRADAALARHARASDGFVDELAVAAEGLAPVSRADARRKGGPFDRHPLDRTRDIGRVGLAQDPVDTVRDGGRQAPRPWSR